MSKIKIKDVENIVVPGGTDQPTVSVKAVKSDSGIMNNEDRRKMSLNKLTNIFKFNIYCRREIEAMITNYNYQVAPQIRKKLNFYKIVENERASGELSAANVNSVVALSDSFLLNNQLLKFEVDMISSTLAAKFGSKFSADRKIIKRFVIDTFYDEEDFYEKAFNLEEGVRMAYVYVYKSRVTRANLM